MIYMGSKRRITKYIFPVMYDLYNRIKGTGPYNILDVFCGGGNFIMNIPKGNYNLIGFDKDKFTIYALRLIRDTPHLLFKDSNELTLEIYKELRQLTRSTKKFNAMELGVIGYAGYACSFGGKFFGGYAHPKKDRDYINDQYRTCSQKEHIKLQGIVLFVGDYKNTLLYGYGNTLFYCDPPYEGTTKYKFDFNHKEFWNVVREQSIKGKVIFVSSYKAPDDFVSVWEKERTVSINTNNIKKVVEKLFIHKIFMEKISE